ncbi:MAG: signal peptidase I [candidate division Zixibacteria bacterium RBG_16_53_22]|nr:MAG: signal peptidase I [candidate division Zixibacteria bacterium RBG_16_53_22]
MIEKPKKKKKRAKRKLSRTAEFFKAAFIILVIGTILRIFVVTPYEVSDNSMQSSLLAGDFLMTSQLAYRFDKPKVGDLILLEHPLKLGQKLSRRIVAVEGQRVRIESKVVYVDDKPLPDFATAKHSDNRILPREFSDRDFMSSQIVTPGHVFVMGDNRDQTEDSRDFGLVPTANIKGKGLFVYFSWTLDPNAPKMESPYIVPAIQIFFYSLYTFPSRVRWDRFFI